ncbi:MAG: UvrD-helicase domain-containing protein [candidate division WOR-3 bacterium]
MKISPKDLESVVLMDFEDAPFIVVPTSAGSGKTELLAKRLVYLLIRECYSKEDLRKFLAITFTREAAKEMKRRVLNILDDLRKENYQRFPGLLEVFDEDFVQKRVSEVYQIILENYPRLQIGTIDSFMERLRRLLLHELGLKFAIKVQYDVDVEVLNLAVENLLNSPERLSEVQELVIELARSGNTFAWDLLNAFNKKMLDMKEEEDKLLYDIKPHPLFTSVYCEDFRIGEDVARALNNVKGVRKRFQANESYSYLLDRLSSGGNAYKFANELLGKGDLIEKVQSGLLCAFEAYNKLETKVAKFYDTFYKPEYEKILNTMGIMTISDTSRIIRKYLSKPESYSDRLIRFFYNIRHVLIDEFQDTDPQQWEILLYLIKEPLSSVGTLFVVGDVKQAIYGFRKADYKIMYNLMTKDGYKNYDLNVAPFVPRCQDKNFRSAEAIVKFVNEVVFSQDKFVEFLKEEIRKKLENTICEDKVNSKVQEIVNTYKNIWIPIQQDVAKPDRGYVKNIKITLPEETKSKEGKLNSALTTLKDLVQNLLKEFSPGDITILTRDNDMVIQIASTIELELKLPVVCYSSLDIRSQKVLWELLCLAKFLKDESDLMSALIFSTGEIAQKVLKKSSDDLLLEFYEFKGKGFKAENGLAQFLNQLRKRYHSYVEKGSLARLFSEFLREFKFLTEDESRSGILRFLNYLYSAEGSEGHLTIDKIEGVFTRFLNGNSESQNEDLTIPQNTEINAIKVMTFHKAKGLGFPVVVNVFVDSKGKHENLYFDRDYCKRLLYPFKIKKDHLKVIDSNLMKDKKNYTKQMMNRYFDELIDDFVQEINTIYVALTRAQKRMYNIYVEGELFHSLLKKVGADEKEYGEAVPEKVEAVLESPARISLSFKERKSEIKLFGEKQYEQAHTYDVISGLKASMFGDAVHEFLRSIDFIETPEQLFSYRDRLAAIANKYYLDPSELEGNLKILVDYFTKDERFRLLARREGGELYREREIGLPDGSFERVDRIIVSGDLVEVIDFKTGDPRPEDRNQIKRYIDVMKKIFKDKKVKGYLAYVFKDKLEVVS